MVEQKRLFVHAVERFMLQKKTNKDTEIANENRSLKSGLYIFCDLEKKIICNMYMSPNLFVKRAITILAID